MSAHKTKIFEICLFSFLLLLQFTTSAISADRSIKIISETTKDNKAERIALIMGNSKYKTSPLKNPVNDAEDIAFELEKLGFQVQLGINMTRKEMHFAIRTFGNYIKGGGIGLFYYAGHGMQVKGKNFLIPTDADINSEDEVEYESIDAGLVLRKMESAGNPMNIVLLDACRDNPFARSFRSVQKGLAQMDAPSGTLIVYATAPGSVASDGKGRNGIFTKNFLAYVGVPGLEIGQMMKRVRLGVQKDSNNQQVPWESSSLVGDFYFVQDSENPPPGSTTTAKDDLIEQERIKLAEEKRALAAEKRRFLEEKELMEVAKPEPAAVAKPEPMEIAKLKSMETASNPKISNQIANLGMIIRGSENESIEQERFQLAEEKRQLAAEKRRLMQDTRRLNIAKADPYGLSESQKFAPMKENAEKLAAFIREDVALQHSLPEGVKKEFMQRLKRLRSAVGRESFTDTQESMKKLKKLAIDYELGDTDKYHRFTILTTHKSIETAQKQNSAN